MALLLLIPLSWAEPFVPEFRAEAPVGFTELNWQVALPVHFAVLARQTERANYILDVAVEPQYQINHREWRGTLGCRFTHLITAWSKGWFVEGGGLVGQDGHGGYLGLGFALYGLRSDWMIITALSPSYRLDLTTGGIRHEIHFDLLTWHVKLR
jgi:hypothetical protein